MKNSAKPEKSDSGEQQASLFNIKKGIDLKPYKTIRIAVSGDVLLNKLETAIIDTRDFQRLRDIKQLGTTHYVYPTSQHTRFSHSLGTLFMAMEMVHAIRENKHNRDEERLITPEEEQLIRIFAILHDIGHIPFGHILEDEFCIFPRHDEDDHRINRFLGTDSTIGRIIIQYLGKELYERFMTIFTVKKENLDTLADDLFIYDIVSNTVCADLLDYLRRDCYFCNIALDTDYGFLKYLYLLKVGSVKRLVIRLWKEGKPRPRRDILSDLVRLLDNRYLLGERIYFHHAKLITAAMIAAAVQRAKADRKLKQSELYEMGDYELQAKLQSLRNHPAQKLVSCLRERYLWKQIYEKNRVTVNAEQAILRDLDLWKLIMETWWENPVMRTEDEDRVAGATGLEPSDFLIYCPDQKMAMKLAEMKVFWNGNLRSLKDCTDDPVLGPKLSAILKSHENLWAIRCFLNPMYHERADSIITACEYLFAFEDTAKDRFQKLFFGDVVDEIVQQDGLATNMLHKEYARKRDIAIKRLATQSDALRDRNMIRRMVKDAFSS